MKTKPCLRCGGSGREPAFESMGASLRDIREAAKLLQKEVAAQMGVGPAVVCGVESGKRPCSLMRYERYVKAVNTLKKQKQ